MHITAVILIGGASTRFGAPDVDKTAAVLTTGGRTILDHLVSTVPADWSVIVVGRQNQPNAPGRAVLRLVEEPPGGGPVAALMVAAEQLAGRRTPPRAPADAEVMAALGGDMPFAAAAARRCVESLIAAPERVDAVVTLTADGRSQPLAAAYRAGPFVSAVRGAAGASGRPPSGHDLSLKAVLDRLRIQTCPALIEETADVDTIQDLERARIIWAANSEPANAAEGDQG